MDKLRQLSPYLTIDPSYTLPIYGVWGSLVGFGTGKLYSSTDSDQKPDNSGDVIDGLLGAPIGYAIARQLHYWFGDNVVVSLIAPASTLYYLYRRSQRQNDPTSSGSVSVSES